MTTKTPPSLDEEPVRLNVPVFFGSAAVILLLGSLVVLFPSASKLWLNAAQSWVADVFGWYYMLLMVACMAFVFWLALSRFGHIRLSQDDEPPQFSYPSWVAMLFSSGIGIALVYYGAYEPLDHFPVATGRQRRYRAGGATGDGADLLHWGLHGWALYALIATALAYFAYCRGLPLALRSALYPIFGERTHGGVGHLVDSFGILVTVISMVTNLGIGALLVNSGLFYLFDIPQSTGVLLALIVVMMVVATLAAVTGVEKGIAMLSNINVGFLCLLLLFVFLAGPTLNLLNGMLQNLGDYLTSLVSRSFDMYLYGKARQWQGRLDAVLLGLVGGVGAVRRAVHRAHFQRTHHSRTDFRRAADSAGLHAGVAVHLRQYRHQPGAGRRTGDPGAGGAKRSADGGVQAVRILALYPADRRLCGGDKLRAVPDAGRFRHADDSEPLLPGRFRP